MGEAPNSETFWDNDGGDNWAESPSQEKSEFDPWGNSSNGLDRLINEVTPPKPPAKVPEAIPSTHEENYNDWFGSDNDNNS